MECMCVIASGGVFYVVLLSSSGWLWRPFDWRYPSLLHSHTVHTPPRAKVARSRESTGRAGGSALFYLAEH